MCYLFSLFGIPVTIMSILGNLLTIVAAVKTKTLRTRYSFLLTTSLACSDLLFSLLCCPVNYITTLMDRTSLDPTLCRINGFLGMLFCLTSILTLSILSLDRYVCIVKPFRYQELITLQRIKIVLLLQWIFSAVIAAVPLSGWGNYIFYPQKGFCFIDYKKYFWAFVFIGVWMYICLGFISFSYYKIFKAARGQRRKIRDINCPSNMEKTNPTKRDSLQHLNFLRRIQKQHKTQITIFATIGAFLLCWAPFCCVNFTAAVFDYEIPQSVDVVCSLLVAVASSVNPILYGWLDMAFRSAFKRLLAPIFNTRTSREVLGVRHANQLIAWSIPNIKTIRNVARDAGNDDGAGVSADDGNENDDVVVDGHDDSNVGYDDGNDDDVVVDGHDNGNSGDVNGNVDGDVKGHEDCNDTEDSSGGDKDGIEDNGGENAYGYRNDNDSSHIHVCTNFRGKAAYKHVCRIRGGIIMVVPRSHDVLVSTRANSNIVFSRRENSSQLSQN